MSSSPYTLSDYDRQRPSQTLIVDDQLKSIPLRPLVQSLSCPICLDLLQQTMVTIDCLHRFCSSCIHQWLKSETKYCPTCRKALKSKRYLRPDPTVDALVQLIKAKQSNAI